MVQSSDTGSERYFSRTAWLALVVVLLFVLLSFTASLSILSLPTDGWQINFNDPAPPTLAHFAGDWPTPLQAGDKILAVNGISMGGREALRPQQLPTWQEGQTADYFVLRDGQSLDVAVKLHTLDAAGRLRSFWYTIPDSPFEWSWLVIAVLVFVLRPRAFAAQLMLLTFVPMIVTTKLTWADNIIAHNFAPAAIFYINLLVDDFWGYLAFPAIILLALSFPQPVFPFSRWPRAVPGLLFGLTLALTMATIAAASDLLATIILAIEGILIIFSFGLALARLRHIPSDSAARAQAWWVIFGFSLSMIPILAGYMLDYLGIIHLTGFNWFYNSFTILVLPASLAFAILRFHLFDIYLIIRRTLQYTLLTGLLVLLYFGGVIVLQIITNVLTGINSGSQTPGFVIVLTTLAIAALFNPLRRRVQTFIDRRFFRSKYDIDLILARFANTAREEVALAPLTQALVSTAADTLQPEQLSLWLKPTPKK